MRVCLIAPTVYAPTDQAWLAEDADTPYNQLSAEPGLTVVTDVHVHGSGADPRWIPDIASGGVAAIAALAPAPPRPFNDIAATMRIDIISSANITQLMRRILFSFQLNFP